MLLLLVVALAAQAAPPLATEAAKSAYLRTGRMDEVERLCQAFAARYPRQVVCSSFGVTPEGRKMPVLVVSADGVLTPRAARTKRRPVVLFQGGIHAGEIDGKDAGFALLSELLEGKTLPGVLKQVTVVFVPVFNVDGHERFGPNQRPNQVGPESTGWRVTAQNLNLNRDYVKADAPEMVAMLKLLHAWDPSVFLDLHVTDGAQFQPDVAVLLDTATDDAGLMRMGTLLRTELFAELTQEGHHPLDFYPSFVKDDQPASGFVRSAAPPRFSQAYWAAQGRIGILVETHSWKKYAARVKTTRDVLAGTLRIVGEQGAGFLAAGAAADAASKDVPATLTLTYVPSEKKETLAFDGYAYTMEKDALSGVPYPRYDPSKPEVWKVPVYGVKPGLTVSLPRGGYLVPAAWVPLVEPRLLAHGLRYRKLARVPASELERFRATQKTFSPASFEGHQGLSVQGTWEKVSRGFATGALFVPMAQPGFRLVAHLFEPLGPDSLLSWGYFNASFEQKEEIESYVIEPWAHALLAKDPQQKAAFEAKLAADPVFAKDPAARLRYFAKLHPSWDTELDVYPVLRTQNSMP